VGRNGRLGPDAEGAGVDESAVVPAAGDGALGAPLAPGAAQAVASHATAAKARQREGPRRR